MAENCIFCRIVKGEIPSSRIFENDLVFSFLDIQPFSQGHCLVIPKQHFARLEDCPPAVLAALAQALAKIAPAVVRAVRAQGHNILVNTGSAAGQVVQHAHLHIIPRTQGDRLIQHTPAIQYPADRIEEITARIRELLI
jgi:histidine triad (HIT) family protein